MIGEVHEELANNPQCSVCGAVMVAGDPWKCLSCEGTVPAVSDEQVKGISEPGPLKRSFPTGKWTWIPDRPQDRPPFDWQSRMPVTDAMRQFYCDACEAYDNSDGSGDALSFEEVVVLQYAAERIARSEQALAEQYHAASQFADAIVRMDAEKVKHEQALAALEARLLIWESEGIRLLKAADKMAEVCDDWVKRKVIDERSAFADARLDYCEPYKSGMATIDAARAALKGAS